MRATAASALEGRALPAGAICFRAEGSRVRRSPSQQLSPDRELPVGTRRVDQRKRGRPGSSRSGL